MNRSLKLLFVFCLISSVSKAEEAGRTCRVIFPQGGNNAPAEAYLFDGKSSHKLSLPSMNFSDQILLPTGNLKLSMTPEQISKPENLPKDAPSTEIPESWREVYLVILNDEANSLLPIKIIAFNASDEKLKQGQTLWINLTKHQIVAELGKIPLTLPPEENSVSDTPMTSSGYFKAKFSYKVNNKGDAIHIMEKSWWLDITSKNIGFVIDIPSSPPKIFSFRDHRPETLSPP